MSYLQGSVPMGVMLGYFAGTVSNWIVPESFSLIQTWRWPFLLQFLALLPINVAIFFVPKKHLVIRSDNDKEAVGSGGTESASASSSDGMDDTQSIEVADITSKTSAQEEQDEKGREDQHFDELEPLNSNQHFDELEPLNSSRGGFLSARGRSAFNLHTFLDETVAGTPMSTRSTTYHDEEDALLASASMYGVSNQRSVRQLLQNQQQQYHFSHCEDDAPSSLRRSMIRPPSMRGIAPGSLLDAVDTELEKGDSTSSAIPAIATSPINVTAGNEDAVTAASITVQRTSPVPKNGARMSSYGALDTDMTPMRSPRMSPRMSMLEASILEEEFIEVYEQGAFSEGVYELLHIPVFCLIVFGLTTVYFVVTGVQYWSTIFMIKSLHASKYLVNALFVVVSGTGPILGVFFGGWLIDRYGGYIGVEQRAKALGICMILGLTAFSISAVTTFFNDVYITSGFLWLLLFFGGAILPACTGIFISVVPAEHRALASSFSVMIFNLFGYSLSPYLTGLIMEWVISKQGQPNSYFEYCDEACAYRIGFRFCLCWSVWSVLCIGSAWHIASRKAEEARQIQQFYAAQRPVAAEV
ncbi:Major Facilitator Superfamily (MFS) transporter [Phytophthora megakarya]|uniref:Major Facilitator Superfamily (MFS) transporter n=1 Tax=Phytophthora megakarya TaxID=4795 RepID=A0A225W8C5_9STRA|nr:Major Facilitator Superfamily (MFS) transporter [Phytophthora megakarya]